MNRPGISTREHAAMSGLGQTSISSSAVWMLNLTFIATILVVPLVQLVVGPGNRPGFGRLISLPGLQDSGRDSAGNNVLERILAVNSKLLKEIQLFEQRIEDESVLSRVLLGPTQHWMTRLTGVGNEQVYSGSDGWLFYRPDVDYITGPGFLDPAVLAKRADSGNEHARAPQPDPRKALRQFKRQLETRGIQLIVMPMPIKPMLRPEKLSSRYDDQPSVLQNVSYDRFKAELEAEGFLVFDVADSLFHREWRTSHSVFLKTDTHWSNLSVERTARQLSAFIHETAHLAPPDKVVYRFESDHVLNQGDLAAMLDMSGDKQLYGLEEVRTRRILQSDGALWEPTESADILLLGDSFTNIYSLPEMAWGDAAGLAEQLSFEMQRPIDRIARNADGAFATRQVLSRELAQGHDRLFGKKVVIWQFAVRELATGDWKRLPMQLSKSRDSRPQSVRPDGSGAEFMVRGEVRSASGMPPPGSVPYRNGITSVHVIDVQPIRGSKPADEIVVFMWGMRKNRLTHAARFKPGQLVELKLTRWSEVEAKYGRMARTELDDPEFVLLDLPTFWAEPLK